MRYWELKENFGPVYGDEGLDEQLPQPKVMTKDGREITFTGSGGSVTAYVDGSHAGDLDVRSEHHYYIDHSGDRQLERKWRVNRVYVNPDFRRQGIASAMYDYAYRMGHRPLYWSNIQTAGGKALWDKRRTERGISMGRRPWEPLTENIALNTNIITRSPSHDAVYEIYANDTELLDSLVSLYKSPNCPQIAPWKVVPARSIERIWKQAARDGFVRNEKGMDAIATQFYQNICRLQLNNVISGHDTVSSEEALAEYFDDKDKIEAFVDWAITTETGGWRISDYGIAKLLRLAALLNDAETAEDKLQLCDGILNVTHPRSDLASWFVQGGSRTMDGLFESKLMEAEIPATTYGYWITDEGIFIPVWTLAHEMFAMDRGFASTEQAMEAGWIRVALLSPGKVDIQLSPSATIRARASARKLIKDYDYCNIDINGFVAERGISISKAAAMLDIRYLSGNSESI